MNIDLSDKVAIVTGGAMGIGLGVVKRLEEAGAKVKVADKTLGTDVSSEEDVKRMVEETVAEFGGIDILVNNAGIYPVKPVEQMSAEEFDKVIAVNLKGVFLCTKYVSEQMIKQGRGGKIINITSIDALHPSSVGLAHYDASKHGVWGFTKNVALELAPHKIWVNAIAPGAIETPGVTQGKPLDTAIMEKFLAKIPMKRMGQPDEIGKVALFLASDMSSYMTGSQIVVDGGVLLS
ncbi:SDR family oxidoreductase [Candidatus Daviesbacteria bacterium]|nr:SDR family oxidoreductase [Candidatus Daviesbacteria bacterium]